MDKKELKLYEAPALEVVELNVQAALLVGSGEDEGATLPDTHPIIDD